MTSLSGDFPTLLQSLDTPALNRLEQALLLADRAGLRVDLAEVVAEIRTVPPGAPLRNFPRQHDDPHEIDSGRLYEISINDPALSLDEAKAQWEREWAEVKALVAAGSSHQSAWEQIRRGTGPTSFESRSGFRRTRHGRVPSHEEDDIG